MRILTHAVVAFVLGGWAITALRRPEWRPTGPLVVPSLIALITTIPATVAASRLGLSVEAWLGTTATILVLLLASRLAMDAFYERRLAAVLVITPFALSVAYALIVGWMWIDWLQTAGPEHGLPLRPGLNGLWLGAPNVVAALVLALTPQAMVRLRRHRALAVTIAALALFTVVISGTRGALVGLVVRVGRRGASCRSEIRASGRW